MSNIGGMIPTLGIPLVLLLANFVSLIMFILYLCPGYFNTRKEDLSAKKQKVIMIVTIACILGMLFSYIMFSSRLNQAIDESKYSVCMFYNAQFDVFNGLEENFLGNNYSFLGFDRLQSYTEIFNAELLHFSELKPELQKINTVKFEIAGDRPGVSAQRFATKYISEKTLTTTDNVQAQPVWSQSLTDQISDEIQEDIAKMSNVATNLGDGSTTGLTIINDFKEDNYVLVASMSRAMDFIINKFKKLLNSSVKMDASIDYVLGFFDTFQYFLVILGILFFAFVPFYIYFYCVRTSNDDKVFLDKILKLVNLFINFMGYISGILFLILVFVVALQASFCFYLDNFLSDPSYYRNNKDLFQIKDDEMVVILENCLDKTKAEFSFIFNQENATTTTPDPGTSESQPPEQQEEEEKQTGGILIYLKKKKLTKKGILYLEILGMIKEKLFQ